MRIENITKELKEASFEYFYWFSRFEFVLKENGFLKNKEEGSRAEPSWEHFKKQFKTDYNASPEALQLIDLHPKRQLVSAGGELIWQPVGLEHCDNDFCKVITMLLTVRNNLFHGGKHGDNDQDSVKRNLILLTLSKVILDQFARDFDFENDYTRYY